MNRLLSTIAALAFATTQLQSCGSDPQTGTSSETQTELQLLADNSRWIDGSSIELHRSQSGSASQLAARGHASQNPCAKDSSTRYGSIGEITRTWTEPCLEEPDAIVRILRARQLQHGAYGTFYSESMEFDQRSHWRVEGHGYLRLRGGLTLVIDTFHFSVEDESSSRFYRFRFNNTCTFDLQETHLSSDPPTTSADADEVHSAVECSGRRIGSVVWTGKSPFMKVFDLEGRLVVVQPVNTVSFPEDSLGLQLVDLKPRSATDPTPIGGRYRLRLLPDETIPDTAIFEARDTGGFGSYLTNNPGRAFRDGTFEAEFTYAPYKPWNITVRGANWEAVSPTILPPPSQNP